MKNKFFSLIFGLIVILASTAFTGCEQVSVKNDKANTELTAVNADVSTLVYQSPVAQPLEVAQCRDVAYATVQDNGTTGTITTGDDTTSLFAWQNIVSLLLLLVSVFFGTYWNKASNTLRAISDALEDRKVTVEEIKKIVAAWKGN